VNDTFALSYTKVEDAGTGALYCQIVDKLHPGVILMSKVNFGGRNPEEHVANYKILQGAFDKLQINRHIPVTSLIKCKYQDNLEFLQYMYNMAKVADTNAPYDPIQRRSKSKGANLPLNHPSAPVARKPPAPPLRSAAQRNSAGTSRSGRVAPAQGTPVSEDAEIEKKQRRVEALELLLSEMETEKVFYQGKIDELVGLLQAVKEDSPFVSQVRQVLSLPPL
jgi:RP/EB family microtubule-associated protein